MLAAQGGVSQTLSVDELGDGEYVAVSKRDGDLGDFVYFVAGALPGRAVDTAPGRPGTRTTSRPDYSSTRRSRIPRFRWATGSSWWLVSRNTTDFQRLLEDPDLGVVEFVQVALP